MGHDKRGTATRRSRHKYVINTDAWSACLSDLALRKQGQILYPDNNNHGFQQSQQGIQHDDMLPLRCHWGMPPQKRDGAQVSPPLQRVAFITNHSGFAFKVYT